jgi:hypothetical protein
LLLDLDEANLPIATMSRQCRDPEARRTALALLARGLGSPGLLAEFAGVSRQVVEQWARDIEWRKVQRAILTKAWRKEFNRGRS